MTKIEELLAVLDMPEDKQVSWVQERFAYKYPSLQKGDLADLAFRLRDEVFELENGGNIWAEGYLVVVKKVKPSTVELSSSVEWWNCCAKPIHWIIAALIAKETDK